VPSARLIGVKSWSSRVLMPNFRATSGLSPPLGKLICKIRGQWRFRICFAISHIRGGLAKPSYTAYRRGGLALHVQGVLDPVFLNFEVHPGIVTARRERRTLAHTALH
jgi:hypothetical protein